MNNRLGLSLADEVGDFVERADGADGPIVDQPTAALVRDLIDEATKLEKKIEHERKQEKQPHLDAAREVDSRFASLANPCVLLKRRLKDALGAWLAKLEAEREAELAAARKAAEDARRAAEAAEEAARQNVVEDPFGDVLADKVAEEARAASAKARELAAQPVNVAGFEAQRALGMTTRYVVTVTDPAALVAHYAARSAMIATATTLAEAEAKASKGEATIPGVTIRAERVVR